MGHFLLRRPEDAPAVAAALLQAWPQGRVFLFNGPMGAGKTTLIKALCAQLGVATGLASPTFSIVHEYASRDGGPVFHFDLYRLRNAGELEGIGFTEYLDSGHYCFIEWPALGQAFYPPGTVDVRISVDTHGTRHLDTTEIPATTGQHA
ncbi:MAG: tRNA (adenosine(37)-N6)-threonylcarbamoyltransferase complex ATPase subunit type 1 TsaE [Flavobacteriales bacterium]|nr:tRNA (adenosine(37)-N6)-threonylcarbamoyltransferase complex ATPase subunit type 1 TsaE [Flavobacteriales bacterium]MCL4282115.1 tRNA (adenosine(37)-N6)-threonylcarbamoyltransferase complex ATPase subunit type 1 TsaE [Flavobacteriales bacterium]